MQRIAAVLVLAMVAGTSSAHAQPREDSGFAESLGVGDNARANAFGPAAIFLNPAGLSRARAYVIEVGYNYLDGKDGHAFSAAAVDSKTNQWVSIGVAYSYLTTQPGGIDRDGHGFRGALSTAYVSGDFAIFAGVGARYMGLQIGKDDDDTSESNDIDEWTLDAGLMFDLARRIKVGVVGANLLDTKADAEAPRKLGVGLAFVFDALEVSGDLEIDLTGRSDQTVRTYGFGAQYAFAGMFAARAGLTIDQLNDAHERISAGFGYISDQFALDLAYSSAVSDPANMLVSVSLRYIPPYTP